MPDRDLIRRTIATEAAYTLSRLQVLAHIPGNPIGAAYRRVGHRGWALMAQHFPVPSFNAVVGIECGDAAELEATLPWYAASGVNPQVEIVPGFVDDALLDVLTGAGYRHSGFHAAMIVRPEEALQPDVSAVVERVSDRATLEEFLDAYIAGRRIPDGDGFKRNVRPWIDRPGWSLFLGRIDGRPAAAAVLYVRDGCGYLADAATDPVYRGRGLQSALLAHRLRYAAEEGAEFVSSGAEFLSTSHRNMVRAGMVLHFVRALWTKR